MLPLVALCLISVLSSSTLPLEDARLQVRGERWHLQSASDRSLSTQQRKVDVEVELGRDHDVFPDRLKRLACKLELPWYVGFDQQYRNKGLSLVGLDMYGETPDAVRSFAAGHQMRYPLAIGTDEIGALFHIGEMPLTVLIDRKGRIAVSHAGVVDPKLFEADIQKLLAE